MKSFPNHTIQRCLYLVPYAIIFLTGIALVSIAPPSGETGILIARYRLGVLWGFSHLFFLSCYLVGLLGNHYLKAYSAPLNLVGLAFMLVLGDLSTAWLLVVLYWIPAISYFTFIIKYPSISEILPGKLYLSNATAASSAVWTDECNITHILDLTGKEKHAAKGVQVKRLRVQDEPGSLGSLETVSEEALAFMIQSLQGDGVLLVHCKAGQSRSAAMVVQYLMLYEGLSLSEAYSRVQESRPTADISVDHLASLRTLDSRLSKAESKED